jgi:DNA-3-methyladenine glycosylase
MITFNFAQMILPKSFYLNEDVVETARLLLGKMLLTKINGKITGGIITETEAYNGATDRACHAFGNRRTARTEVMFSAGGVAYVYLCYGIHSLFNVVTGAENNPQAVLIRGLKPLTNLPLMEKRLGKKITAPLHGPGLVSKALGIYYRHSGLSLLTSEKIWIEDHGISVSKKQILVTPRIGVHYAGKDALLPYRFVAEI